MLPTEVQRILLLIGLAATAYLMILAWNEDFVQQDLTADYAATPDISPDPLTEIGSDRESGPGGTLDLEAPFVPAASQGSNAAPATLPGTSDSDVPDVSLMSHSDMQSDMPADAPALPPREAVWPGKTIRMAVKVWFQASTTNYL